MKLFKKFFKFLLFALAVLFVGLQFLKVQKNISFQNADSNITKQFPVPADVETILRTSCYDCHSNNTRYPWYAYVQPVGWWLNDHIDHGKDEVNFDEFASYRLRRQYRKFHEIQEQLTEDKMPLSSYLLIHKDAILSADQKNAVITWSRAMQDSMKAKYPIDSLERRRQ